VEAAAYLACNVKGGGGGYESQRFQYWQQKSPMFTMCRDVFCGGVAKGRWKELILLRVTIRAYDSFMGKTLLVALFTKIKCGFLKCV
jgi:hypothetical protein